MSHKKIGIMYCYCFLSAELGTFSSWLTYEITMKLNKSFKYVGQNRFKNAAVWLEIKWFVLKSPNGLNSRPTGIKYWRHSVDSCARLYEFKLQTRLIKDADATPTSHRRNGSHSSHPPWGIDITGYFTPYYRLLLLANGTSEWYPPIICVLFKLFWIGIINSR